MNEDHLPPEDEFVEWLPYPVDIGRPDYTTPWAPPTIPEPPDQPFSISERLRAILREVWRNALPVLGELLRSLSEILRPTGFKFLLTLLALVMVFRLTYPLFFFEPPSVTKLLDTEVSILPWNASFIDLTSDYSKRADLSETSIATLDEFGYYLGRDNYEDRDLEQAERSIDLTISEDPDNPFLYLLRAEFLRVHLADPNRAVTDYTIAIELDNALSTAFLGRGFCHLQKGQFLSAVRDLNAAIRLDQDPRAYRLRGVTYEHLGLYHNAISDYTVAIELDESDPVLRLDWVATLFFRRGYAYRAAEQWDECVADFGKSMETELELLGVAWKNTYLNRAYCLVELGRYEEALADYRDVLEYWSYNMDEEDIREVEQQIASLELTIKEQAQE